MSRRKIAVVTGTRAEYGLLTPLLRELERDAGIDLQLIVTGMHLSPEFGMTVETIVEDGFRIDARIEMLLSSDTPVGITKSMGLGLIGFADALERLRPDIIVLLGDRYEILVAAQAAMIANIPIAHIHGGEKTEGAIDESIRHSITKMSHVHFTATEQYRQRVIQMGEHPDMVFNFGAIGLDNIYGMDLLERDAFEKSIDFQLGTLNFLVTYHPVTLSAQSSRECVLNLLQALDHYPDAHIIFTKPNSDTDGRIIAQLIDEYVDRNRGRAVSFINLGQLRYLSALRHVDLVIGNSSSGIIEAPAFHIPTINIGTRQQGRIKGPSIIDCESDCDSIVSAIQKSLLPSFRERISGQTSPYGEVAVSPRIKEVLKTLNLEGILLKSFQDIPNI